MFFLRKPLLVLVATLAVNGCSQIDLPIAPYSPPTVAEYDTTHDDLLALPDPKKKVVVAVYAYPDKTGKFEPSDTVQSASRAVSQGADTIILKALQDAGDGAWFTVVERAGLNNLLKERQILRESYAIYNENTDPAAIPPLKLAGLLLEGGVISFDSNQQTGGKGARFLGIGAHTQYRKDVVVVYLRATSVLTGEILAQVNVTKTLYAAQLQGDVFRFVSDDRLLELEAGVTINESEHFALKQAIEKAVIALIFEGVRKKIWGFSKTTPALRARFEHYLDEKRAVPLPILSAQPPAPSLILQPERT
jgi:curli production assembly/transport component CsgG